MLSCRCSSWRHRMSGLIHYGVPAVSGASFCECADHQAFKPFLSLASRLLCKKQTSCDPSPLHSFCLFLQNCLLQQTCSCFSGLPFQGSTSRCGPLPTPCLESAAVWHPGRALHCPAPQSTVDSKNPVWPHIHYTTKSDEQYALILHVSPGARLHFVSV